MITLFDFGRGAGEEKERYMEDKKDLKEMIRDLIKKAEGEPVFSGDMTGPYVALYYHLKDNVSLIKGIYAMMEQASKKRSI